MENKPELVIDAKAALGEGPCWDEEKQSLYWVDILEKKVHIYNFSENSDKVIETGQLVGAAVLRKSGGVVLALQNGFYFLDEDTGKLTPVCDPESHLPENRFNDGKCDAKGRFWAGTMSLEEKEPLGSLYCLDCSLNVRHVLGNITISNGIAWSPDNRVMYFVDTPTKAVAAFDFDLDTGHISNKRTVVEIPENSGFPDGMTIDSEGMLWVAHWNGWQVSRWNPQTGKLLQTVPVPAAKVTSCTFGGPDLDDLYITTARKGFTSGDSQSQPHAGGVFRVKTYTRGMPANRFNG